MTLDQALTGLNDQLRSALPPELAEVLDADRRRVATDFAEVGAKIEDFTLPGADGAPIGLAGLVAEGPAVLVFYRGQWCPYCNLTLRTYQEELLPELEKRGAALAAISPQRPDGPVPGLGFPVLSDVGSTVARGLGLSYPVSDVVREAMKTLGTDLEQVNGSWELVHPAVVVVGRDRVIRYIDVHPDFVTRTEPADILKAL
ncbi:MULTISPECIES: peroxiredoxin-like family protein [unclassified Amycolatopsis]|uniref:peroxiredoxin-like family protein n=1 Tax=unclassified Amycolatopsis TaxID=2618356 RepID=UPI002875D395|nr:MULTISPECIES: peroxiredoxin-like family protein [unclassified Amycolatopsis]MDS0133802.1 AhpC/TSA family protein [Amycolatopsis sp. 505]MDS0144678.1 AhpC/TSA family protein [Amycolatopsis sp. CM201R]